MGSIQITTAITKKVDITNSFESKEFNFCKKHNVRPKIFEIYTGRKKFQGVITECHEDSMDDCACYAYTFGDLIKKWNKHNPHK